MDSVQHLCSCVTQWKETFEIYGQRQTDFAGKTRGFEYLLTPSSGQREPLSDDGWQCYAVNLGGVKSAELWVVLRTSLKRRHPKWVTTVKSRARV